MDRVVVVVVVVVVLLLLLVGATKFDLLENEAFFVGYHLNKN